MDTHFEQTLPRSSARPELSLPGEDGPISALHAEPKDRLGAPHPDRETDDAAAESAIKPAAKRRSTLMTSAAIGVMAVAAAGVFLISPYNHVLPLNLASLMGTNAARPGATQHIIIPAPVAPAASLARAPIPQAAPVPNRSAVSPQPRSDEMQEIVNLQPGRDRQEPSPADKPADDRQVPPQAAPPVAAASVDAPPTLLPASVAPVIAPIVTSAPAGSPASTAPGMSSGAVSTPPATPSNDPVVNAATLQAGPMSTPQQIEVLNVVAELGVLLRNQRAENAQLRADVQQMRERLDSQLNDYGRRLSLAEARGAISAAMGAGVSFPAATSNPPFTMPASITVMAPLSGPSNATQRSPRAAILAPGSTMAPIPNATLHRYRVQAASPGLAMLAEVDRTGDAGNLLQVSIGDEVPGFGKVRNIAQQGAAWVLTAERGTIR